MSFYFVIAAVSLLATGLLRAYTLEKGMLDLPNERSSHSLPTPRGGGLAIVLSMLLATIWLALASGLLRPLIGMCVAGLLIAITGFIDDRGHISAKWRLLIHFICSGVVVWGWGGLPVVELPGFSLNLGWYGNMLAVVGLVWVLNLYNFMDGIDGIAGVETVTTATVAGFLLLSSSAPQWLVGLHWGLAAATFGFLVWNFPPARIFMGDAGSGFLGLMVGALVVAAAWHETVFLWVWLILLGVFLVDATVTLGRRLLRRLKVYEAHRTHAYQYASRRHRGHLPVTLAVMAINLTWLTPIGYAVVAGLLPGLYGLLIAYAPLVLLAFAYSAGVPEHQK